MALRVELTLAATQLPTFAGDLSITGLTKMRD